MKTLNLLVVASILLAVGCKPSPSASTKKQVAEQPVLATFGPQKIYTSDFEYVYKKNNANSPDAYLSSSLREYLDLYTNFRLKVKEAEDMGLDTSSSFTKELEGYRKQLAQPYLTEKGVTEKLCKEAYQRMGEEINASHILIEIGPDADPKDTLAAYTKLIDIRQKALSGQDFGVLAMSFSQDPSAKTNKGNLGYFTALQMVYPFEEAAYNTKIGEVSSPVRTRFGYHILKIHNRRTSQGQVRAAHIMVRATSGMSDADSIAAKQKAEEIYKRLKEGENWEAQVNQFTDDVNSKNKGGELPWFSTGRMIPSFEDAAFGLSNVGDLSAPVLTPYGWHIIKLLEKKKLEPYEELESSIKAKVAKDSRSELNKTVLIQRLKKENNFIENTKSLDAACALADSSLFQGAFFKKVEEKQNLILFTINADKYTTNQFFDYVKSTQKSKKGLSPSQYMRNLYKEYSHAKLLEYEEDHLAEKYLDYKMLVREYRDGILLFQLMDEKVWSKAIEDTAGLKAFFAKNNGNYKWDTRVQASIFNVSDNATLEKLKQELKKDQFSVKDPKVASIFFQQNKTGLTDELKRKIDAAIAPLVKDKALILKIEGSREASEVAAVSKLRADSVKAYLIGRGINASRIQVSDNGRMPTRKLPSEKEGDRKVKFTFFSTSKKVLENQFNEKAALTLQLTEGKFQKGDQAILDTIIWEPGTYSIDKEGRINYIIINKVETPRLKTFEEARGLAISDYQTYLEKEWIYALKTKNPVVIKEEEFIKLIKK